jgi:hypothetical protein
MSLLEPADRVTAFRAFGAPITWTFATPRQARRFFDKITATWQAPDTGTPVNRVEQHTAGALIVREERRPARQVAA